MAGKKDGRKENTSIIKYGFEDYEDLKDHGYSLEKTVE